MAFLLIMPVTFATMPVTISEMMALKIWHWPVKLFEKVPVNKRKCP